MSTIIRSSINFHDERFLMFVLDQMANELESKGGKAIRMTLGKSELPLHPDIISSMQEALQTFEKYTLVYPGGLPELKEKLAGHYERKYNVTIKPDNFIISVGTSSVFRNLFYLLLKEGDEVLLPFPYYSLYHFSALLVGAKVRHYKINLDTLALDVESFEQNYTDKTKVVVINTPGNPLGNILTRDELNMIDRIVDGRATIINDEIYANTYFDDKCESVMQLKNTKSQFVTTDAFSKGYRMYSKRVGYAIVPDELVQPLTVIQHHTLLTADPIVQFGAMAALDHQHEVEHLVSIYKMRREYTLEAFRDVEDVRTLPSRGGFYITIDCQRFMGRHNIANSLELATELFQATHVATVPGSDFGLPSMLRLSYSTADYEEGIDRMVQFFKSKR
ncbi:aspartate aminotransferase [Paenibacillus helianthi]|uniref:Aspartate aminotransferase n=1 Tax=Paenibacillus helianthi TaxID=1349432 RepID=A0ABX3EI62_9BACL|nr:MULTISPECIES: aminotransferase class I/II-fold pyridoxal phosphate-dependent enzyme [Paenibacillus]OKP79499.1 aspartate aminotransferase [Paenibacillus helianthi]OKP94757.1 aspartate aminotransferase [Paenibacillus sp. P32E]